MTMAPKNTEAYLEQALHNLSLYTPPHSTPRRPEDDREVISIKM